MAVEGLWLRKVSIEWVLADLMLLHCLKSFYALFLPKSMVKNVRVLRMLKSDTSYMQ